MTAAAYLYGKSETRRELELEEGDCPACVYVHRFCELPTEGSGVAFVVVGDVIRRVEIFADLVFGNLGPGMVCTQVTADQVEAELAAHGGAADRSC